MTVSAYKILWPSVLRDVLLPCENRLNSMPAFDVVPSDSEKHPAVHRVRFFEYLHCAIMRHPVVAHRPGVSR